MKLPCRHRGYPIRVLYILYIYKITQDRNQRKPLSFKGKPEKTLKKMLEADLLKNKEKRIIGLCY